MPQVFANFVKVIEKDISELVRFHLPVIFKFLDELIVKEEHLPSIGVSKKCLPFVRKSEKAHVNAGEMIKDGTETHDLVFERTLVKVDVQSGSYGSVKLIHNLVFNPVFDGQYSSFVRVLSNYKGRKLCTYKLISSFLTITNAILCFWFLQQLWPVVLALSTILLITEVIEVAQERILYFKHFDNLLELVRSLLTIIAVFLIAFGVPCPEVESTVILINALKCFGLAKFVGCFQMCYVRTLHVIKSFCYAVALAVVACLVIRQFFSLEGIIYHLLFTLVIIGFFMFEGHCIPAREETSKVRELLRVINRNEKLKICCRRGQRLRYLHSLSRFELKP